MPGAEYKIAKNQSCKDSEHLRTRILLEEKVTGS